MSSRAEEAATDSDVPFVAAFGIVCLLALLIHVGLIALAHHLTGWPWIVVSVIDLGWWLAMLAFAIKIGWELVRSFVRSSRG